MDGDPSLVTMTLRRWLQLEDAQRASLRTKMGSESLVLEPETGLLPIFTHRPSGLRLVLLFGDRILMGATDAYRHGLRKEWAAERDGRLDRFQRTPDPRGLDAMRPAHLVDVPSFLLSELELGADEWQRLGLESTRKRPRRPHDAGVLISAAGLRWPSEAELDLARMVSLAFLDPTALATGLCADAWHQGYSGGPPTAEPWGLGPAVQRVAFPGVFPGEEWIGRAQVTKGSAPPYRPALGFLPRELAYAPEAVQARAVGEPASDDGPVFEVRSDGGLKLLVPPVVIRPIKHDAHLAGQFALDHEDFLATFGSKPSSLVEPPPKKGAPRPAKAAAQKPPPFGERYVKDRLELSAIIQGIRQGGSATFDGTAGLNPIDYHFELLREPSGLFLTCSEFSHDVLGGDGSRDLRYQPVTEEEATERIWDTLAVMPLKVIVS